MENQMCKRYPLIVEASPEAFEQRLEPTPPRPMDWRTPYTRDKARIIHSAAFRRLQGKTQVMGTGEGDFHRTRLTHTLEVMQIGTSLLKGLRRRQDIVLPSDLLPFLEDADELMAAACYGHDLGHPPYGHGGEQALHRKMKEHGGFEGNAQNIRLLTELEKYHKTLGINPTRRLLLAILKYPVPFSGFPEKERTRDTPPKCFYDQDMDTIAWAAQCFSEEDRNEFFRTEVRNDKTRSLHKTLDCSIMECADDIAYSTHDLEDIVARGIVRERDVVARAEAFFSGPGRECGQETGFGVDDFRNLFGSRYDLKATVGSFVNALMTNTFLAKVTQFEHPLLANRLCFREEILPLVRFLKTDISFDLVISRPEIRMLERKGQRIIETLFDEFLNYPKELLPHWNPDTHHDLHRYICNYLAGMTDHFAESIHHRLFTPGKGNSRDEI